MMNSTADLILSNLVTSNSKWLGLHFFLVASILNSFDFLSYASWHILEILFSLSMSDVSNPSPDEAPVTRAIVLFIS